jgi:hypothetical protein
MAVLAGLLGPEPAGLASDNAASVTFLQRMGRGEGTAANSRQANGDVREAIARLVDCRGISGCCAFKVKEGLGLVTTSQFRKHNEVADQAAKAAVLQHPAPLRGFIRVMRGRGKMYIRFLQELTKLFIRIARAVEEAYDNAPLASIYGRRRMARAEAVALAIRAPGLERGQPLGLGYGPHLPSQWAGQAGFLESLRAFWANLVAM